MTNERLLYQVNSFPSILAMFYLVFNTLQTIFTLNTVNVSAAGIRVMEIILLNIILSFLVFIISSEIKRYSTRWSWTGLCTGVFQCLRVLFIPTTDFKAAMYIAVPLVLAGLILIFASIWSLIKSRKYRFAKEEMPCHTSA